MAMVSVGKTSSKLALLDGQLLVERYRYVEFKLRGFFSFGRFRWYKHSKAGENVRYSSVLTGRFE